MIEDTFRLLFFNFFQEQLKNKYEIQAIQCQMNKASVVSTIRKDYEFLIKFIFQYCGPHIIRLMFDAEAWFKDAMAYTYIFNLHHFPCYVKSKSEVHFFFFFFFFFAHTSGNVA